MHTATHRPRALITGLRGFTGRYLADALEQAGYQVHGTVHGQESQGHSSHGPHTAHTVDLTDRQQVQQAISDIQPDIVAHLAAISFVAHGDAETIYRTNIVGTRNLLDALASQPKRPRAVLVASSANIYGNSNAGVIAETEPAQPANDYGISKLAMEHVARLWMEQLPITIVRPFNYTGVGQADNFLLPKIISHYHRRAPLIELGNLDVARDFSDVRTVVHAYTRLLQQAPAGQTYNICSGQAHTLQQVLDIVAELAGYKIEVRVNPAFVRSNEVKTLTGNPNKLAACVGALPPIGLRDTLAWMLASGAQGQSS